MNETNPIDTLVLAVKVLEALATSQASPGEKAAALKVAAFAIEQAAVAQNLAVVMANIVDKSKKP